jgi:uncharacterized protein (UPF0332 family)
MKEYDLNLLFSKENLDKKFKEFLLSEKIKKQIIDDEEIKGHLAKTEHNLRFIQKQNIEFSDWIVVGCYYACYHCALAATLYKGYTSKNHLATLIILIKEYYDKELSKEDFKLFSNLLDYHDILFYVETKNKREDASYSTKIYFDKAEVEDLKLKTILFVSKIKELLNS